MMISIAHVRKLNKHFKQNYSGSFSAILKNDCIEIKYICGPEKEHEVTITYDCNYGGYCICELNSNKMLFRFLEGIINVLKEVDEGVKDDESEKNPVVVEAVQLNNEYHSICEAIEFVEGFDMSVSDIETKACVNTVMIHGGIFIKTLEGNMKASFW